jgi:hypothetical protein
MEIPSADFTVAEKVVQLNKDLQSPGRGWVSKQILARAVSCVALPILDGIDAVIHAGLTCAKAPFTALKITLGRTFGIEGRFSPALNPSQLLKHLRKVAACFTAALSGVMLGWANPAWSTRMRNVAFEWLNSSVASTQSSSAPKASPNCRLRTSGRAPEPAATEPSNSSSTSINDSPESAESSDLGVQQLMKNGAGYRFSDSSPAAGLQEELLPPSMVGTQISYYQIPRQNACTGISALQGQPPLPKTDSPDSAFSETVSSSTSDSEHTASGTELGQSLDPSIAHNVLGFTVSPFSTSAAGAPLSDDIPVDNTVEVDDQRRERRNLLTRLAELQGALSPLLGDSLSASDSNTLSSFSSSSEPPFSVSSDSGASDILPRNLFAQVAKGSSDIVDNGPDPLPGSVINAAPAGGSHQQAAQSDASDLVSPRAPLDVQADSVEATSSNLSEDTFDEAPLQQSSERVGTPDLTIAVPHGSEAAVDQSSLGTSQTQTMMSPQLSAGSNNETEDEASDPSVGQESPEPLANEEAANGFQELLPPPAMLSRSHSLDKLLSPTGYEQEDLKSCLSSSLPATLLHTSAPVENLPRPLEGAELAAVLAQFKPSPSLEAVKETSELDSSVSVLSGSSSVTLSSGSDWDSSEGEETVSRRSSSADSGLPSREWARREIKEERLEESGEGRAYFEDLPFSALHESSEEAEGFAVELPEELFKQEQASSSTTQDLRLNEGSSKQDAKTRDMLWLLNG